MSNYIDALLCAIRNMPELPSAKIRSLIRGYFQQCLNVSEEIAYLAPSDSKMDFSYEASELLAEVGALKSRLASQNYDNFTKNEAEKQLSKAGLHYGALDLEQLDQIHSGFLRAQIENRRILAAKLIGNYDQTSPLDPLFAGMQATGLPPIPGGEEKQSTGNTIWGAALQRIQQQGIDANINTEIPDFVAGIFKKAIDAGYGQENVMALVKVLQGDRM